MLADMPSKAFLQYRIARECTLCGCRSPTNDHATLLNFTPTIPWAALAMSARNDSRWGMTAYTVWGYLGGGAGTRMQTAFSLLLSPTGAIELPTILKRSASHKPAALPFRMRPGEHSVQAFDRLLERGFIVQELEHPQNYELDLPERSGPRV